MVSAYLKDSAKRWLEIVWLVTLTILFIALATADELSDDFVTTMAVIAVITTGARVLVDFVAFFTTPKPFQGVDV